MKYSNTTIFFFPHQLIYVVASFIISLTSFSLGAQQLQKIDLQEVISYRPGTTIPGLANTGDTNAFRPLMSFGRRGSQRTFVVNAVITLTVTITNSTCNEHNGGIIITASGGTAPYIYTVDDGVGGQWILNNGNFQMLLAANYTITVTDANGESAVASATIDNDFPAPKLLYSSYQAASACTANDASITFRPVGGTPPFQYSLDNINYQANNVFANLYPGYYRFLVKDANGCMNDFPSFLVDFLGSYSCPIPNSFSTSYEVCGNVGGISIDPFPGFVYSLDGVNYQNSGDFYNLGPGIHNVYYKGPSGIVYIFSFSMYEACYLDLSYISVEAACQQSDGALTVTAINGVAPYSYSLDGINFQSSNVFTGLASGNYTITVKDATTYRRSATATVSNRCPRVTLAATDESCPHNDGTITATGTKGTPPYQYSIDGTNFQTSNVFTGLAAGPYTITLKDAMGFTTTGTTTVGYYCLSVTAVPTNVVCTHPNGIITASPFSGTPPYQYSLDGINFQTSNIFSGLAPATYTVTIKDNTGHTATTTVSITDTPGPTGIVINTTPASCLNNDGTVTGIVTGGTPPLRYSMDGINYQSSNVYTNLTATIHHFYFLDVNGCGGSITADVSLDCPIITAAMLSESCGAGNGSFTITVGNNNGFGPYEYSLDGINFQTSDVFINLSAGTYTITIKNRFGVTHSTTAVMISSCPTVIATGHDGVCGNNNGTITVIGSSGTAPYRYAIDGVNFQTGATFSGLAPGPYTITVKDARGATNTTTVSIGNIPGPQIIAGSGDASCLNNDGIITVSVTGGTAPFQYSLDGISFQNNATFSNIASGIYNPVVKDANGCTATQLRPVAMANNLTLQMGVDPVICEGDHIQLPVVSNGTGFSWVPPAGLDNIQALHPQASPTSTTKYYVIATLGVCSKKDSIIVNVNPAPVALAGSPVTICKGQSTQLVGNGGTSYSWTPSLYLSDPGISNPVVNTPLSTTTYQLTVKDGNGCSSLHSSLVTVTVISTIKVFAGNDTSIIMNQPFRLLATDINNSGFTQYTWSPVYGLDNPVGQRPFTTLDRDITYHVTATTTGGCEANDDINIKVYLGPEIYVPSGFSPNNDGRNDLLKPTPVGIKSFKYFAVYNRWGQQIFYSKDPAKGWDGKIRGVEQDTGTFIWIAEGVDEKGNLVQRKGSVTLIR